MIPPCSFVSSVYWASPSARRARSFESRRLEQLGLPRALDVELTHVRDVEDATVAAHGEVLGDHAVVLHGHLPAGEGNHAGSERDVTVVQGRPLESAYHDDHALAGLMAECGARTRGESTAVLVG